PGTRTTTGGIANNWKLYWCDNTCANPPLQNDIHWQLLSGTLPCGAGCTVPAGQEGNVKWIKWEVGSANSYIWDRFENFAAPIANLTVVTNSNASGTITNSVTVKANNVCQTGCSASRVISSDNKPLFEFAYQQSTNSSCAGGPGGSGSIVVQSGATYCALSSIANQNGSHGDANDVYYTMRLPDRDYLDPLYDPSSDANVAPSEKFALCLRNGPLTNVCPDANGVLQTNPSWLQPESYNCALAPGSICTVTWHIPKIYAKYKYPPIEPYAYVFWIQVKTKPGLADQQKICLTHCTLYSLTTTPANGNNNLPFGTTNEVTISASVDLAFTHNVDQSLLSCGAGNSVTYSITYQHNTSTGGVDNLYVLDRLPEITGVTPPLRLIYASQNNANAPNTNVYFLTSVSRKGL
ncbi:MAG: hypothetical protein Q7T74_02630, partial [Candidatus Saccharibacteria bacterium]|nr:hypothetical protein [Candidatus Saccharibacteria bacterium]